ncbi:MAG: peptidyl-prolyl cis-trans isomerase [Deltaproteobacteria bacterium]|nr:peptidyl-prolyl cis-trans isomerase [Deltaproteobacteria bacterium]
MLAAAGRIIGAGARLPALHFLLLGAGLAALQAAARPPDAARGRDPIVISAARVAEIRADYARSLAPPTSEELRALVARAADEEMLYREALVLGLDRGDGAVRWRVVEKMHFLYGEAAGDAETAYRRGIALGLDKDDVVVRNALVTKMRLLAKAASRQDEPTGAALDRELVAFMTRQPVRYRRSDSVTLTQVFLNATTRGATLDGDAWALLARLRSERVSPEVAARFGDPFIAGSTLRAVSRATLAKTFGDDFAVAALALPADTWSEPIRSPYGVHLVRVSARRAGDLPPLDAVRARVLRAWRAERRDRYLARMMDELRAAYVVRVENEHAG